MSDLRNQITAARTNQETGGRSRTIQDLLNRNDSYRHELARVLANEQMAEAFLRTALTECRRTPRLFECEMESFAGALMICAQLKLQPGPQGHIYLLPYWNSKRRKYEAQAIVGYVGMIQLAMRSGQLAGIAAHVVREHDVFKFQMGSDERIVHEWTLGQERGEAIGYYAAARFVNGGRVQTEPWSVQQMKAHRDRYSPSKRRGQDSPWDTNFDEMAEKTMIRQLRPFLPASPDFIQAIDLDAQQARWTERGGLEISAEDLPTVGASTETDEDTREDAEEEQEDAPRTGAGEPAPGEEEGSESEDASRTVTPRAEGPVVAEQGDDLPLEEGR